MMVTCWILLIALPAVALLCGPFVYDLWRIEKGKDPWIKR